MGTIITLLVLTALAWGTRLYVAHLIDTKQIIGDEQGTAYMVRYFISKPNTKAKGRIYIHQFLRSDHDRALHDHPWNFISIILKGGYWEFADERAVSAKQKGEWDWNDLEHIRAKKDTDIKPDKFLVSNTPGQLFRWSGPGSILKRGAGWRHRVALPKGKTAWTLIYTSPKVREWGFWPGDKFCHWTKYDSAIGVCNDPQDLKDKLKLYTHEQFSGYDWDDLERVMSAGQFSNFKDWMRGQTMAVLDGKAIVYEWDLDRFLAAKPAVY
jgi:hypothetical protein